MVIEMLPIFLRLMNSMTVKYYSSTGDLAIDIVANWELRRDILAKLKLMKAS